jgi:HlyD family secretion protein
MSAPVNESQGDPDVVAKLGVGRRRSTRRWLLRLFLLAAIAAAVTAIAIWRVHASKPKQPKYMTAAVEQGNLRETVTATGTLSPLEAVEVGAEVTGRVAKVHVDINDPVKLDQVLVELDTEQLEARVEETQAQAKNAQASLLNAKATLSEAKAKAKRTRELFQAGLMSAQEVEAADATLDRAKASVSSASAQITVAQASVKSSATAKSKAIIRSPIDGIVLARSVEAGQTVTSGLQTPILFTLARDLTQMQLRVDVDEADVGKVQEGQRATFVVDAYPKRRFSSEVVRLSNLPKGGTTVITYEAVLKVDNSERLLRPGMTATATIVTSQKEKVLLVPNAALRFQPPQPDKDKAAPARPNLPVPGLGGPVGMRGPGMRGARAGGSRPSGGSSESGAGRASNALWVLKNGEPSRLVVEVGSSDGRRTEVSGKGLAIGTEVIVDVEEAQK